jgi:Transcriptional regulator
LNTKKAADGEKSSYSAPAASKLLDIIELLGSIPRELSINEIARLISAPVNTVYRICLILESRGYLQKDYNTGLYQLGMGFRFIGEAAANRMNLRRTALPVMYALHADCGETVHLCVLNRGRLVLLDQVETELPIKIRVESGSALLPYASAFGKALLAFDNGTAVDDCIAAGMERLTASTITSPETLRAELAKIRASNLSYDREEYMDGVVCVGSAVFGCDGRAVCAIGVMGPKFRFDGVKLDEASKAVSARAAELSGRLGWRCGME